MPLSPVLRFGALEISPPLVLAPMAGLTHSALRGLIADFGGCGLFMTEMLSAAALPRESAESPYLIRTEKERPLSHQLLTGDAALVPAAVERLHALGADAIDLNLGCPAPNVRKMGGGACLLSRPEAARDIVTAARRGTNLPLSAKIRLPGSGPDAASEARLRELCRMLEGEGVDLVTVHARFVGESFARRPRWDWAAKVKTWVRVPVVVNGGVDSATSARECLARSGADGLMIGRQAAAAPWIFADIARDLYGFAPPASPDDAPRSPPETWRRFADALEARFPPERRLGRLKEFTHHFAKNFFFGHHLASRVQGAADFAEARDRASEFFARQPEERDAITNLEEACHA